MQNPANITNTKSIVVSFISDQVRDRVLRIHGLIDSYTFNDIYSESNLDKTYPIYLHKMLPQELHNLFMNVRRLAKEKGYRKPWVSGDRIALKKSSNSGVIHLTNLDYLSKIK